MSDEEKEEYLEDMNKEFQWKMGEGNPHSTEESKIEVTLPKPILGGIAQKKHIDK